MNPPPLRLDIPSAWYPTHFQNNSNTSHRALYGRDPRDSPALMADFKAVGDQPNDEDLIVSAIYAGKLKGLNPNQALDGLHTTNEHTAYQWREYYLTHRIAIVRRVESLAAKPSSKRTAAGPKEPQFAADSSVPTPSASNKRRKTNSVRGSIPNAPSEEPIPPNYNLGKYTQRDVNYMVKLFAYELNEDSTATRAEICAKLGKKAPQHSPASWKNYSLQFLIIDKMFRRAGGEAIPDREFDFDNASDSEDEAPKSPQKHIRGNARSDLGRQPEWAMKNEGPGLESSDEDENDVGHHGDRYTMTELRIMAKWISRYSASKWTEMTQTQRWEPFTPILPTRTSNSLKTRYSNDENKFLLLANRYRKRRQQRKGASSRH